MGIRDRSVVSNESSADGAGVKASKRQPSPPPGVSSIGPAGDPFHWSPDDEPHKKRRTEILKKYPQIEELFVPAPITFVYVSVYVALQIGAAYWIESQSYFTLFLVAYFFGGFLNHALNLAAHELSHNLCWQSQTANKLTAILSNLPTAVPSAITFARYHHEHHLYQGYDGIDVDIPTVFECNLFANTFMKALWLFFQPFAYALRPVFIKPKPATAWEAVNWVICISFDIAIYTLFGAKAFAYLLASTFLGLGLHPSAGHFIAEHFEFVSGQETYSYYGLLNVINFNVGYHNEHHDFPRCPWVNLPKVKAIAPEFYSMPSYTSYIPVMWKYITDPNMGPFSRIKRRPQSPEKAGKPKTTLFAIAAVTFLVAGISFPVIKAYSA